MPIPVGQAFKRTSADPVDETLNLTKAQMLGVNDDLMPDNYLTVCKDDGKVYAYNKSATANDQTGKFSVVGGADYTAGQGIRIENSEIDTPLLDEDYVKESTTEHKVRYDNVGTTENWTSYADGGSAGDLGTYVLWATGYTTNVNGKYYLENGEYKPFRSVEWNQPFNMYTYDGGSFLNGPGSPFPTAVKHGTYTVYERVEYDETTETKVHNLSGIAKEDYSDEWFSDLTEQDVHNGVESAFTQGAVTIQEQYEVGEEVLIGTWKENNVVYDLWRRVLDFGALPNNAEKTVQHGVANIVRFVKVYGIGSNAQLSGNLPYIDTYGYIRLSADSTSITVSTNSDRSAWTALAIIEYTKARG